MNLQIGWAGALTWLAYAMIWGFIVRAISSKYPDNPFSKALAFIW